MLSISECDDTTKSVGSTWIPAFAGMTKEAWIPEARMHPRPTAGMTKDTWIPEARMHIRALQRE